MSKTKSISQNVAANPWGFAAMGAVVLGLMFALYKGIQMFREEAQRPTGINDLIPAPAALSYPPAQYVLMADRIAAAMDGNGTDHATVVAVLKQCKNAADYVALSQAFGIRENTYGGIFSESGNLLNWLRWEYSDSYNWILTGRAEIDAELTRLGQNLTPPQP
jgi:hypothetical protein